MKTTTAPMAITSAADTIMDVASVPHTIITARVRDTIRDTIRVLVTQHRRFTIIISTTHDTDTTMEDHIDTIEGPIDTTEEAAGVTDNLDHMEIAGLSTVGT